MSTKLFKIKEIKTQKIIHGIFHCKYKENKKTKYGDPYISVGLVDSSGSIEGKIWEYSGHYDKVFEEGDIVAIKGSSNIYRKNLELNILHIAKYSSSIYDNYGFKSDFILSKIDFDSSFLFKEVCNYFSFTGNNSKIIKALYKDYKKSIVSVPYSLESENQSEGSYLNNLYRSLKIFDLLNSTSFRSDVFNSGLIYSLLFLKNFHMVVGCQKNIIYTLNDAAKEKGALNVFHDCFKKYEALASKKDFSLLERCIFDPSEETLEEDIVSKIFRLVEYAD